MNNIMHLERKHDVLMHPRGFNFTLQMSFSKNFLLFCKKLQMSLINSLLFEVFKVHNAFHDGRFVKKLGGHWKQPNLMRRKKKHNSYYNSKRKWLNMMLVGQFGSWEKYTNNIWGMEILSSQEKYMTDTWESQYYDLTSPFKKGK